MEGGEASTSTDSDARQQTISVGQIKRCFAILDEPDTSKRKRRSDDADLIQLQLLNTTYAKNIQQNPDVTIPAFLEEGLGLRGTLSSGSEMLKLKKCSPNVEILKLPRFGAKLNTAPDDYNQLQNRLNRIYRSKLQAFKWPRYHEVSLISGPDGSGTVPVSGGVGKLNLIDFTVSVERFRGSWSQYFGRNWSDQQTQTQMTDLTPFEAYFLADLGNLEVTVSEGCVLSLEELRATLEANVPQFACRYGIFSEIHRATQLYLKTYGSVVRPKKSKRPLDAQYDFVIPHSIRVITNLTQAELDQPSPLIPQTKFTNLKPAVVQGNWTPVTTAREMLQFKNESVVEPLLVEDLICSTSRQSRVVRDTDHPPEISAMSSMKKALALQERTVQKDPLSGADMPETIDMAFTCYSKVAGAGTGQVLFDVAITDYHAPHIPVADLFRALRNKRDPALPLYVVRNDNGQLSGFSAVLADIPTVCYQGT